jgi:monoamine oxidase
VAEPDVDVVVVGAGLAGLCAADALHAAGRTVTVLEARAAVGGRIKTLTDGDLCLDLGATWHWSNQPAVRSLVAELGLEAFPQFRAGRAVAEDDAGAPPRMLDLPPPEPAELRLAAGTQSLCLQLAGRLPDDAVIVGREVSLVALDGDCVVVTAAEEAGAETQFTCQHVVVAVPPRLARAGITFTPELPDALVRVMEGTPTWMATAVKCIAVYESPFWRDAGLSGLAFSRPGPLTEVHDGCTLDGSTAALWGFMSPDHTFRDLEPEARMRAVFDQLGRLFGPPAADPLRYIERDWSDDPYTNDEVVWFDDPLPHGQPALSEPRWGGRLLWAGTETAKVGAGHMEGAVRSGRRAAVQILSP